MADGYGSRKHPDCYLHGCPCGYAGDPVRECRCSGQTISRYQKRISGPLLDRIDIHVEVPRIDYEKLSDRRAGELSRAVRERVECARLVQAKRFAGTSLHTNADMGPRELQNQVVLDEAGENMMKAAVGQLHLSAPGYHRVLMLSRTIAGLAGDDRVRVAHLAEALKYRPRHLLG